MIIQKRIVESPQKDELIKLLEEASTPPPNDEFAKLLDELEDAGVLPRDVIVTVCEKSDVALKDRLIKLLENAREH